MRRAPHIRARRCSSFPCGGVTLIGGSPSATFVSSASSSASSAGRRCCVKKSSTSAQVDVMESSVGGEGTAGSELERELPALSLSSFQLGLELEAGTAQCSSLTLGLIIVTPS